MWEPQYETMTRDALAGLQLTRLKDTIQRAYENVPLYRNRFREAGITPDDIRSLADVAKLPFTVKTDFRDNYPYGLLATPLDEVVRLHASSGTTGKPIIAPYTAGDVAIFADLMARSLHSAGVRRGDVMQNAYGYGLFTGGLGFHYGGERLGATVVPVSSGNTKRQIMLIQDLGTTVITCTPSYALVLGETARELGVDLRETKLRLAVCGAEPWTEAMRTEIEAKTGTSAIDTYGLTEIMGPGVGIECEEKAGMHLWEDHFLVEIIDPVTNQPLPYGEQGELIITTLTKEALPIIRFRTRDLVTLNATPCACGRTMVRMSNVKGRTDDMLIIRGVNVFPTQIESALLAIKGVEPHYQIIVDRERHLDDIEIWVEVSGTVFSDEFRVLEELEGRVRGEINSILGISARVKLVEPRTITRTAGKAKRVIDRRELESQ